MRNYSDQLLEKILNRDTELQRAYDWATEQRAKALTKIAEAEKELAAAQKTLDLCIERATEQNCMEIL